jgi:hypothetical protein
MKMLTQFEIPAGARGPVFRNSMNLEPIDARNTTDREIPAGHLVAVKAECGELLIVCDLGEPREQLT